MLRLIAILGLAGVVGACAPGGGTVSDPSPQAELEDQVSEPTDGLDNEVGVDD